MKCIKCIQYVALLSDYGFINPAFSFSFLWFCASIQMVRTKTISSEILMSQQFHSKHCLNHILHNRGESVRVRRFFRKGYNFRVFSLHFFSKYLLLCLWISFHFYIKFKYILYSIWYFNFLLYINWDFIFFAMLQKYMYFF